MKMNRNTSFKILLSLLLFLAGCKEALLHNLSEIQVNRLIGILNIEGIEASKELQADSKWTLNVKKQDLVRAISLLDSKRLLKDNTSSLKESSSLLGSSEEKNFYFERVLSAELEKTLLTLSGVFDARVHLNIKKSDILNLKKEENVKSTASVLMVVSEKEEFDEDKIKSIISGASGIEPQDVSIVISRINIVNVKNDDENAKNVLPASKLSDDDSLKNEINATFNESETLTKNEISLGTLATNFLKENYYYLILGLVIILGFFAIKSVKKYRNSKKLDLMKAVTLISK